MKISELYKILDEIAPFASQASWDNSGLLLGSQEDDFSKIYASLDIDNTLLDEIEENSLLLSHHPLIFKGLKKIDDIYPSSLLKKMIKKDIKLISLHTNFDLALLNRYFVEKVLNFKIHEIQDFIIYVKVDEDFDSLAKMIKEKLRIEHLRFTKAKERISSLAICTGSGSDLAVTLQADCFLTGDIKYHFALESLENGLSLIDIEHYHSEKYFAPCLQEALKTKGISIIIKDSKNPFSYI